jgi:hypothetical protein
MYKVVAERLDPNGPVYRMERNLNATSVDFVSPRDASGSYVNVWQEDGTTIQIPVSCNGRDYQCVIVYGANREVVQYIRAVDGVVSQHEGPMVDSIGTLSWA